MDLPLRSRTPPTWAEAVLRQPLRLLDDHAHLERAAAANALELLKRRPTAVPADRWVERLSGIARDEIAHLSLVVRELTRRGGDLSRGHRNAYAAGLRRLVRTGDATNDLVDRLLTSALIEARSFERFGALAATGDELADLYASLQASEEGHYRLFVRLAELSAPAAGVAARWEELLDAEAEVLSAQPHGPGIHSGA